jgi:glutamate dehydrogenase
MVTISADVAAVITAAAERLPEARRELFTQLAGLVLAGLDSHPAGGEPALAALARDAFELMQERAPGETRVRVRNPEDRPAHSVLEVLQDDHPFIVDTLRLALRQRGLQERLTLHPVVRVERDADHRLRSVGEAADAEDRESYVCIEFVPRLEDEASRAELEEQVRRVMGWVDDVSADHRRMVHAVRELSANLELAGPELQGGAERAARIQRFLDWLIEGRFVLIGLRRYRVDVEDDELVVQIVPGTGLGMWRDDASSRLSEPRRGSAIPEEIREDLEDPRIILISKSHMESRVHRRGRLDRILVKEHDDQGRVIGATIVVGLFTHRVLRTPGSQIPLLGERLREVIDRLRLPQNSYRHKAFVTAFDSAPIELLVGAEARQLGELLEELVEASSSQTVRLVSRVHPSGRSLYAAVLIPREHYREDLRARIRSLLVEQTGASYIDDRVSIVEEGSAIVHCFCTSAELERLEPDLSALEEQLRRICSPWEDQLLDALRAHHGERRASELAAVYETAFPEALRACTHPLDALHDVEALEGLAASGLPQFALWFDSDATERASATLRLYLPAPPLLSDVLPVVDHFGIRVVDAQLATVTPAGQAPVAVESLRILPLGADQEDLDAIAPRLSAALAATLAGAVESDPLNGLVLGAGLDWREVDLVRAFLEYFIQIQGTLSRPYLRSVLLENPLAVRVLVHYFEARLDPALDPHERDARCATLAESFRHYRDRITALNEDRALQGFFELAQATLRTNFFAPAETPHRIVLKLDSSRVPGLSGVVPYREIVVHSAQLFGIHLRGGPVARGGLRWSDRHDDLRREVLGLMSTQMLKNGLIVPVGAKGGFVLRQTGLSPGEARARADEQYRVFVASLLDLTDNLAPDASVIPPPGVHRLDDDDPYLVVAADKGTAHLSDTANQIALARDFWLGDAFASGGSEGYDHKKFAITARGAWECVKHHFAELGIDPETDVYRVAGIGDMSGDVFGNGLQLMRRAKLLAAFDHRHIFLDPDPDPDASWKERQRLFELSRSSWSDYAKEVISEGGGVWARSSKRIPVPAALREALQLEEDEVNGAELIRAILAMDVDLLWNGGIGTYVKASHESHPDVGDRANEPVRIDATALRARVIGEGGNLGLTQAARVEAALRGVRLDTDAIDNSAGVDLSDHEVNYKIALAPLVRAGALGAEARRDLLLDVADTACEHVLAHNRQQALSLSLDELRSRRDPGPFLDAISTLSARAHVDPDELGLPNEMALGERATHGMGLTRPELAVLLGLAKLHAQGELHGSGFGLQEYVAPLYASYFPARFREEQPEALRDHRLRGEIATLCVVNRLIDAGGAALVTTLSTELGVGVRECVCALLMAEDLLRINDYRRRLLDLMGPQRTGIYEALVEVDDNVRDVVRHLVRRGETELDAARVVRWREGIDVLRGPMAEYLSPGETMRYAARRERLEGQGLPPELALDIAGLPLADRGLSILWIAERAGAPIFEVARTFARIGDQTGINWIYARLAQGPRANAWDRIASIDLHGEMLELQQRITEYVLSERGTDANAAVDAYLASQAPVLERVRGLQQRAAAGASHSALTVVASRLRSLKDGPDR